MPIESNQQAMDMLNAQTDSKSLLKRFLTQEVFEQLKDVKTSMGSQLKDVIASGAMNPKSGVGIYAADAHCYDDFALLFDPVLRAYHKIPDDKPIAHPKPDFNLEFKDLDPENKYVKSIRVRCARTFSKYPMNPTMTKDHYLEIQKLVTDTVKGFEGDLAGEFLPLTGMDKAVQQKLIDDHYLFKEGDPMLEHAEALHYWPEGRGIYLNNDKTFLMWVNEEDHLRVISMEKGGNLKNVVTRFRSALEKLNAACDFAVSDKCGFLSFCPTNCGNGVRASVHIRLPQLLKDANRKILDDICDKHHLQVRGIDGEHSEAKDHTVDISNKRRLGYTEAQVIADMQEGVIEIIAAEKKLE